MADIFHHFVINAAAEKVFSGISTPQGLDAWWSKHSTGTPALHEKYMLHFGAGYDWPAVVTKFTPNKIFELKIHDAHPDWDNTLVGFVLEYNDGITHVQFYHTGWPQQNDHFKISSYCWAMYLRLLKRYVEFSEVVDYEKRLEV